MINGQRFETFSKTQNLGFASIADIKDSEVYNSVSNKLKEIGDNLKNMAKSVIQGFLPEGVSVGDIRSAIDNSIRYVKDTFTAIKNITGTAIKDIENLIAGLLPQDSFIQNAFRNLTSQCRNSSLGKLPNFKRFNDSAGCGSSKGGYCSPGEIGGFFSKLTNGAVSAVTQSMQSILNSLVALGNLGYSGNLCKIFSVLTRGMSPSIIQRGAASILATVGGLGQTNAVLDIAANMGTAIPSLEIPGLVSRIASNFSIPDNYLSGQFSGLYDGFTTALGSIEPDFNLSDAGDMLSVASMGGYNDSLGTCAREFLADNVIADFNAPVYNDDSPTAASYVASQLKEEFGDSAFSVSGVRWS